MPSCTKSFNYWRIIVTGSCVPCEARVKYLTIQNNHLGINFSLYKIATVVYVLYGVKWGPLFGQCALLGFISLAKAKGTVDNYSGALNLSVICMSMRFPTFPLQQWYSSFFIRIFTNPDFLSWPPYQTRSLLPWAGLGQGILLHTCSWSAPLMCETPRPALAWASQKSRTCGLRRSGSNLTGRLTPSGHSGLGKYFTFGLVARKIPPLS